MGFSGRSAELIAEAVAAGRWSPLNDAGLSPSSGGSARTGPPSPQKAKRRKPAGVLAEPRFRSGAGWAEWTIPLRLDPTTNGGAFKRWQVGVAGKHRRAVGGALSERLLKLAWFRKVLDGGAGLACTITRLGGGAMDTDNLPPTGKWCRDTVALFLGQDDGPDGPITWEYAQEPGKAWGVRIRLEKA